MTSAAPFCMDHKPKIPCSCYWPKAKVIQSRVPKQNNCPGFGDKNTSSRAPACTPTEQGWLVSIYTFGINHALWTVDCGLWTVDCGLWTVDCGLWTVDCGLWTVDCGLWTVDCGLWTADSGL